MRNWVQSKRKQMLKNYKICIRVILQAENELSLEEQCCSGSHGSHWWKSRLLTSGSGQYDLSVRWWMGIKCAIKCSVMLKCVHVIDFLLKGSSVYCILEMLREQHWLRQRRLLSPLALAPWLALLHFQCHTVSMLCLCHSSLNFSC